MDFDPRDDDPRQDEARAQDRDDDAREPRHRRDVGDGSAHRPDEPSYDSSHRDERDRDDEGTCPHIGRGPSSHDEKSTPDPRDRDEARRPDRDRDPRDVFTRDLDLPRGRERAIVRDREREYTLRGSESRTLATVGAFRVVSSRDLGDHDRPADPRSGDLRRLREQRLIETTRVPGSRDYAVSLTKDGRSLLERHRDRDREGRQTFYAGVKRERELEHDVQVYRAFEREAERLEERGARVDRVILDYELKRDYQKWLHERDRDRDDYDGHPDRDRHEIEEWAREHDLPYFDQQVHFPDLRIEYEDIDGRRDHLGATMSATIGGSYGGASASAVLSVTGPTVATASFGVSGPTETETCTLSNGGATLNCTFNGSTSTAPGTIVAWDWSYGVATTLTQTTSGPVLTMPRSRAV